MKKTILVTGATGNIGSLIVPQLIDGGARVKVLVRNKAKAEHYANMGVELIEGDFNNEVALNEAAKGVDALLAITPPGPEAVAQGANLLKAAMNSGSPHYVRISAIGAAADAPTENGKLHHESDTALMESGLTYTILRPHYFMQNFFASVDAIKNDGNIYAGMGDGKMGTIDVRDIADSAAAILLQGGHENKIYTPTGPSSISFYDAASIMSGVLDKTVTYVPVPIEAVGEAILKAGWGEWGAQVMMDYSLAYSKGWGDFANDDVKIITGNDARSFENFVKEVYTHAF